MTVRRKKFSNTLLCVAAFIILSLCVSFAAILYDSSVRVSAIFSLYQIVLVFLPGVFLTELVFSSKKIEPLEFIFISFAFGYALNIIEYFAVAVIGLNSVNARIVSVTVLLILTLVYIKVKPEFSVSNFAKSDIPYLFLFGLLVFVIFFASVSFYVLPNKANNDVRLFRDGLYWIENAAALKISFPPQELRYSGMQLFYHYFVSIYVALASLITEIDCFRLGYSLCVLTRALLLFGGTYVLGKIVFEKTFLRIILIIAILFSTGNEHNTQSNYVSQLIYLPFGFDIAIGYGAYAVAAIYRQNHEQKVNIGLCICTVFSMLMCIGHKAPVSLIFMLFAGIMCFSWLINKQGRKAFSYGIPLVIAFLLVMIVCIGVFNKGESRVNTGTFGINANVKSTWLYEWHDGARFGQATGIKEKIHSVLTWLAAFTVMEISFNPFMLFIAICGFFSMLKRKTMNPFDLSLLIAAVFGICMGSFNEQDGMSQMYYSQAAFLPGIVFGLRNFGFEKKSLRTVCGIAAAALFLLQIKYYFVEEKIYSNSLNKISALINHELPAKPSNDSEYPYSPDSMQYSDYEALVWIRDNTPVDSILVSDRDIRLEQHTYMYHGTFSERQMYLEGDCYLYGAYWQEREQRRDDIRWIYLNDQKALEKAKNDGVDYLIETKWITPVFEGNGCTLVFENETIRVWKT